jgi:chaperonin GroES
MTFRALNDRVLVKADEAPGITKGGIIIPDSAKEKTRMGIVRHVGPGSVMADGTRWPIDEGIKVGARVVFVDQPWPTVELAGEKLLSMRDDVILAVMEE